MGFFQKAKTAIKLVIEPFVKMARDTQFRRIIQYTYFLEKLNIQGDVILYESFHGKTMTDSPYAIFKQLIDDPNYRKYKHVWAINSLEHIPNHYKNRKNIEFVPVHSYQYKKYLASAKYLINNTTFPSYFQKKKGQIYVNTWHGTPLKTLGKDMRGEIGQHKNIQRNFLHSDYILNPNQYTADILVQSHDLEGIFTGKVVVEGYPRIDLTLNTNKELMKRVLSEMIEIDDDKKLILYAPTWRGQVHHLDDTEEEIHRIMNELLDQLPSDYQLLLKVHTLTYKKVKNHPQLKKICIPDWIDSNELLSVVDLLITDYSSIFFDYLVTKKPIIFYMYDRDVYENGRGLYLDLDTLPGPICTNTSEVIHAIKNIRSFNERYLGMRNKYCYLDDGLATKRNIDIIFHNSYSERIYQVTNDKKNILFYCGGFLNNGITTSAINLLNQIDYSKYNVAVIDKGKYEGPDIENFLKLNPNVKRLFRFGSMNMTIKEYYQHHYLVRKGLKSIRMHKYIPVSLYKRECSRLFGQAKFDIAVDFSGYVPFWSLLFAFGEFRKKSIYQHNDMLAEYHKKINHKYKHRSKLNVIFPLYRYFNKVVSVAEHTRDVNFQNLKEYLLKDKAVVVHNCIDPEKVLVQKNNGEVFMRSESEFLLTNNSVVGGKLNINGIIMPKKEQVNFVTMGRLSPEKDHKKLIRAFSKLANLHDNVKLFIIGEGILESELKGLCIKRGLAEKVTFTGQLSNPFYFINLCDCFVLSSKHEGQPMVLLEALILGIPIISTDIAGSRSILKGGYGDLVKNSEEGLCEAMEGFLAGKILQKKFNYEQYNRDALAMFYEEVCRIKPY